MVSVRELPTLSTSSKLKERIGSLSRTRTPHVMEYDQKTSFIVEWIKNVSHGFLEVDDEQQDLVGNIVNTYPNLVDLNSPVPEADPYVLALAILNKRKKKYSEVILFNEEIKTDINQKMKNKKSWKPRIPNVCEDYGIRSLTIRHLMPRENWTLR